MNKPKAPHGPGHDFTDGIRLAHRYFTVCIVTDITLAEQRARKPYPQVGPNNGHIL